MKGNKKEKNSVKKPFFKKWWFWVIVIIVLAGIFGSSNETETTKEKPKTEQNEETKKDVNTNKDDTSKDTEDIKDEPSDETDVKDTETVAHREGMYGISDKDVDSIDAKFTVSKVNNDTTGNWRISSIAENINIEEYALSYYNKYFKDNKEIHGIVNFNYKTTTAISYLGDRLDITIHEYVDKEEHDAKLLYSGKVLKEYFVYLDNGDIEEVQ